MMRPEPFAEPAITEQARENRAYVRRLLREKQPEFAAMLEAAVRELLPGDPAISGFGYGRLACRRR